MAYGLQYKIEFTNIDSHLIEVEISAKDATPSSTPLIASSSSPVVVSYKSGDLYANDPIRASTASIKYILENDVAGLTTFVNVDDTYWKVDIYMTVTSRKLVWTGFISQDDSIEDLTPQPNEVTLNCNDGLGMMKYSYFANSSGVPYVGDALHQMTISEVFRTILNEKTGLSLPVNIYCNLFENGQNDRSVNAANEPFSQTKIDVRSFLLSQNTAQDYASGVNAQIVQVKDKVQDNYTIMQNLLDAWGCTLLQANGEWNIIRWHELKQFDNAIPGTQYNADFTSATAITFSAIKDISADYPTINLSQTRQLFRPNEYVRNTFNYEQTNNLIQNADWSSYGALLGTQTTGSGVTLQTTKDYVLNDWYANPIGSQSIGYVRIVYNYLNVEIDRYGVVQNGTAWNTGTPGVTPGLLSLPFMISAGDQGTLSFTFATAGNNTGPGNLVWHFVVRNAADDKQWGVKGDFKSSYNSGSLPAGFGLGGYAYSINADTQLWQTVTIDIPPIPFDGNAQFYLQQNDNSSIATFYRDINLQIYTYIDGSVQVNGQYSESKQPTIVKKNISKYVYFDDAPKITIKGGMYLTDGTTKTSSWHRAPLVETRRFGFIQTVDWMYLTNVYRSKIDGQYRGLTDGSGDYMNALCVTTQSNIDTGNYIFGQCSFDYKNAEFQGTVQEVYKTGEYTPGYDFAGTEFTNTFSYLYAKK